MFSGRRDNPLGGIGIIRTSRGSYLNGWKEVSGRVKGGRYYLAEAYYFSAGDYYFL